MSSLRPRSLRVLSVNSETLDKLALQDKNITDVLRSMGEEREAQKQQDKEQRDPRAFAAVLPVKPRKQSLGALSPHNAAAPTPTPPPTPAVKVETPSEASAQVPTTQVLLSGAALSLEEERKHYAAINPTPPSSAFKGNSASTSPLTEDEEEEAAPTKYNMPWILAEPSQVAPPSTPAGDKAANRAFAAFTPMTPDTVEKRPREEEEEEHEVSLAVTVDPPTPPRHEVNLSVAVSPPTPTPLIIELQNTFVPSTPVPAFPLAPLSAASLSARKQQMKNVQLVLAPPPRLSLAETVVRKPHGVSQPVTFTHANRFSLDAPTEVDSDLTPPWLEAALNPTKEQEEDHPWLEVAHNLSSTEEEDDVHSEATYDAIISAAEEPSPLLSYKEQEAAYKASSADPYRFLPKNQQKAASKLLPKPEKKTEVVEEAETAKKPPPLPPYLPRAAKTLLPEEEGQEEEDERSECFSIKEEEEKEESLPEEEEHEDEHSVCTTIKEEDEESMLPEVEEAELLVDEEAPPDSAAHIFERGIVIGVVEEEEDEDSLLLGEQAVPNWANAAKRRSDVRRESLGAREKPGRPSLATVEEASIPAELVDEEFKYEEELVDEEAVTTFATNGTNKRSEADLRKAVFLALQKVEADDLDAEVGSFNGATGMFRVDSKIKIEDGSIVCLAVDRDFYDFVRCRAGLVNMLKHEPGGLAFADELARIPRKRMKSMLKAKARNIFHGAKAGERKWQKKQLNQLDEWLQSAIDLVIKLKDTSSERDSGSNNNKNFSFCGGFDHIEIEDFFKCFLLQGAFFTGVLTISV